MRRAASAALAGAALVLIALLFDTAPLFVPGAAFVLLGSVSMGWIWISARRVAIRWSVDRHRVVEDEALGGRVEIRTRGRLALPRVELLSEGGEPAPSHRTPTWRIGAGHSGSLALRWRFPRRGRQRIEAPLLRLRDPLGLASLRVRTGADARTVLVLPRTEPLRWLREDSRVLRSMMERPMAEASASAEVDGLRPYRTGTPASRIHWPALAKGAGLLERRLRADRESRPLVVLDSRCDGAIADLDAAVRAAASIALDLARRGGCGLLLPGERRVLELDAGLGGWPGSHARLALIEPAERAPALARHGGSSGPLVYVAAQPPGRIGQVLRGRRPCMLVLPSAASPPAGGVRLLEAAGCSGYAIAERRLQAPARAA